MNIIRTILHDGLTAGTVVEIKVPAKAGIRNFPAEVGEENTYTHFSHPFKGGMVNLHVRTRDVVAGSVLHAKVQVVHKIMPDGREFLYVDLFPTDEAVTHRLVVFGEQHEPCLNWTRFEIDTFVATICLVEICDDRAPRRRNLSWGDDISVSSPFAALAGMMK